MTLTMLSRASERIAVEPVSWYARYFSPRSRVPTSSEMTPARRRTLAGASSAASTLAASSSVTSQGSSAEVSFTAMAHSAPSAGGEEGRGSAGLDPYAAAAEMLLAEGEVEAVDRPLAPRAGTGRRVGEADQHRARAELESHLAVPAGAALGFVEDQLAVVAVARRHEAFATAEGEFRDSVHRRLPFVGVDDPGWAGASHCAPLRAQIKVRLPPANRSRAASGRSPASASRRAEKV